MNDATPFGPDLPKNRCALGQQRLPKVHANTLVLWGMNDVSFDNEANLKLEEWVDGSLTIKAYPNTTHWIAQEMPAEVAREANAFFIIRAQA